ncbi:flagellar hook-associated protein FlgK [Jeotgalibaca porci]|uniref:flagellar hook-associated protein FlgK n=1 Tax=Jeotgalibaca porci TaxID=1868793 RepID=UPI00359F6096
MSGLFGTLNIGVKGMTAAQTALQTTSHNVSNMNTPGYSRQRVNLQADNPYNYTGVGQLGTGVKMSGVVRVVDDYVTKQIQDETSSYSRHATKSDALSQLEMIFDEPSETGLSAGFSRVYAAWNYLGSSPELATAKTMVSQESQTLTDTIKQMANQIEGLEGDTLYSIEKDVLDFNEKVGQLSTLNKQIFNVVIKGQTPNDLLDQRDRLTTELASIAGVSIDYDKFQGVKLTLDGNAVLDGDTIQKLAVQSGGAKGELELQGADGSVKAIAIENGSIKGSQEALAVINDKKVELDQLAYSFAMAVNTVHETEFFTVSQTDAAKNITVNAAIKADTSLINAGKDWDNPEAGDGDGSRATAISALASTKLNYFQADFAGEYDPDTMKFKPQTSGTTTNGAYNDMVTSMGIIKQQADNIAASQSEVLGFLEDRRSSISGVNMNEEVVDMMKFQSAFQANARIISIIDEMLDTLINRTGV